MAHAAPVITRSERAVRRTGMRSAIEPRRRLKKFAHFRAGPRPIQREVTMKKFIIISSLFFACATGEQMTAHKAPPAPTSPPIVENEVAQYAQPPSEAQTAPRDIAPEPSMHAKKSAHASGGMDDIMPSAAPATSAAPVAEAERSDGFSANKVERRAQLSDKEIAPRAAGAVAPRPAPQLDRPGLATSWGETRYSPVDEVQFERDSTRPTCQGSLWYNDRNGAEAAGRNAAWSDARLPIGCGVSLELHGDNGGTLAAVRSGSRLYAVGESNQRYTITVHNNSNERYEMVVSVDGLDVINGKPAGFAQRGYLVPAHSSVDIEGFRRSGAEVAAFRFGSVSDSYAAQSTGQRAQCWRDRPRRLRRARRNSRVQLSRARLAAPQRRIRSPRATRRPPPVANNIVY